MSKREPEQLVMPVDDERKDEGPDEWVKWIASLFERLREVQEPGMSERLDAIASLPVVDEFGDDRRWLCIRVDLADLPSLARHIRRDSLARVCVLEAKVEVADLLASVGMLANEAKVHRPRVYGLAS